MFKKFVKTRPLILAICLLLLFGVSAIFPAGTSLFASAPATASSEPNNLLQYEWPQATGDASRSFASAGPGPNSFNIKWKAQVPGVLMAPVAFSGKVFVENGAQYYGKGNTTYALDASTGQILWKTQA
jgi:hypothetical protein